MRFILGRVALILEVGFSSEKSGLMGREDLVGADSWGTIWGRAEEWDWEGM